MSTMENLDETLDEHARQAQVNQNALDAIQAEGRAREAQGYSMMAAITGYGKGSTGDGAFGKISHVAKLFCIAFAFLAPSILIWQVMLK